MRWALNCDKIYAWNHSCINWSCLEEGQLSENDLSDMLANWQFSILPSIYVFVTWKRFVYGLLILSSDIILAVCECLFGGFGLLFLGFGALYDLCREGSVGHCFLQDL